MANMSFRVHNETHARPVDLSQVLSSHYRPESNLQPIPIWNKNLLADARANKLNLYNTYRLMMMLRLLDCFSSDRFSSEKCSNFTKTYKIFSNKLIYQQRCMPQELYPAADEYTLRKLRRRVRMTTHHIQFQHSHAILCTIVHWACLERVPECVAGVW